MGKRIEDAMFETLKKDIGNDFKNSNLLKEISELGIEEIVNNELIKKIPVVNVILGFSKGIKEISDVFFLKKLFKFLSEVDLIPLYKRVEFLSENFSKRDFEEKLLFLLSKLDDLDKPKIIGKLFRAMVYKKITEADFFRLSGIIDRIFFKDLIELKNKKEFNNDALAFYLMGFGILTTGVDGTFQNNFIFNLSEIGKKLIEYGLKDEMNY